MWAPRTLLWMEEILHHAIYRVPPNKYSNLGILVVQDVFHPPHYTINDPLPEDFVCVLGRLLGPVAQLESRA